MDFKTYYLGLPVVDRAKFALRAGTTVGTCNQITYAKKQIELGLADVFVALSEGALTLDSLPLTERATQQRRVREGGAGAEVAEPAKAEG